VARTPPSAAFALVLAVVLLLFLFLALALQLFDPNAAAAEALFGWDLNAALKRRSSTVVSEAALWAVLRGGSRGGSTEQSPRRFCVHSRVEQRGWVRGEELCGFPVAQPFTTGIGPYDPS
jgi:hypothetical protein